MDSYRIQIFHVAHRNCRIIRITNDFIFNFFKTFNAFFNQYLMNRRQGKRIMNKPQKFLFIVCKPSPGSAQSKSRTQNYRITDGLCRLKGFFCCIGDKGRQYRLRAAVSAKEQSTSRVAMALAVL